MLPVVTIMEATKEAGQDLKALQPFPLLRLPLELRRYIYTLSLVASGKPYVENIYLKRLPKASRDPPSPLLRVNGQVRGEIIDLIRNYPITLRVTYQGTQFDCLAETCFIAQGCSRDYSQISDLGIEIWPPHPDRPADLMDIWKHLRKLRKVLRGLPALRQISIKFANNAMATWTHDGKALDLLDPDEKNPSIAEWGSNDLTYIMSLFTRVIVAKVFWYLPGGLTPGKANDSIHVVAENTRAMMMGLIPFDEDTYADEDEEEGSYNDFIDDAREWALQRKGALIARDKLDAMTSSGWRKLTLDQWEDFNAVWSPDWDMLSTKEFKGMQHYISMGR